MRQKRWIRAAALIIALCLALSGAVPAFAGSTMQEAQAALSENPPGAASENEPDAPEDTAGSKAESEGNALRAENSANNTSAASTAESTISENIASNSTPGTQNAASKTESAVTSERTASENAPDSRNAASAAEAPADSESAASQSAPGSENAASTPEGNEETASAADRAVTAVNMYRLYNPNSGEHFFTGSEKERDNLINAHWNYEGIGWIGPAVSETPVYRLYNKNGGEHHFTTNAAERDGLIAIGWQDEGIGWYSDDERTVPLYRVYNPNAFSNNHHYTTSFEERNSLIKLGWRDEGIGWYASAAAPSSGDDNPPAENAPAWIWYSSMPTSLPESGNVWGEFRRTFTLDTVPATAKAQIAVESRYWLWVNGTLAVFDGGLKRGQSTSSIYYDTVDLAPYLTRGTNTIAILVWYWDVKSESYSNRSAGAAGLWFSADIGNEKIVSNGTWKAAQEKAYLHAEDMGGDQPNFRLPESNIYYEARLENAGWTEPGYDDSQWADAVPRGEKGDAPWGEFVPRSIPLFSFSELKDYENSADFARKTCSSAQRLDLVLPKNKQITPYLEVEAPAGQAIDIRTDRYTSDGVHSLRTTYVTKAGTQQFESLSWVNGKHVYYTIPAGVKIISLKYRESGYQTEMAGHFTSSDSWLNQLWQMSADTVYLCMRDSYMDCPDRERAQWWGDAAIEMLVSQYAMDQNAWALYEKGLATKVGWDTENKLFTIVPWTGTEANEIGVQELCGIQSVYQYYMYTGRREAVELMYTPMKNYLTNWTFDSAGLVSHYKLYFDWTDWGSNIDVSAVENAWYYIACDRMADMADILEKSDDASYFRGILRKMKNAYRSRFWTGEGYRSAGLSYYDERANALAVIAGIADADQYPAIREKILAAGNCSPYMEHYVTDALFMMGYGEDAIARMKDRYGTMVANSDGTLWELFDGTGAAHNHGWSAGPAVTLSGDVAGIYPTEAGYAAYEIKPQPMGLTKISCSVPSAIGTIRLDYAADAAGKAVTMNITAPSGGAAEIAVPKLNNTAPVITVNGAIVFRSGSASGNLRGFSFSKEDDAYVYFSAGAGTWNIEMR